MADRSAAAALLGVERVRLYHDNALPKEPGTGRTPWHYDAHHFPLNSPDVLTAWIPLQPTPREMGPLAFARGADTWKLAAAARMVLATTYFRDGVRVVPAPTMISVDWQKFIPSAQPGEVVASEYNPVIG